MMPGKIKQLCATFYGVTRAELESDCRKRRLARPRQVTMTLCRHYSRSTLPSIGRRFNRDHTTVLHAIRTVDRLCAEDDEFFAEIASLCSQLEAGVISDPKVRPAAAPADATESDEFLRRLAAEQRHCSAPPPQAPPLRCAEQSWPGATTRSLPALFFERTAA